MPADEARFNLKHSRTRIAIECAFGLLKGKYGL
jgi:hypothetical protein